MSNSTGGSDATVSIYSGGTSLASIVCAPGQTVTKWYQIPAGTYQMTVQKNTVGTGIGASGSVYEWIPSTINTTAIVGGLRIRTITQNEGNGSNNIVTNYTYGPQSTGILYSRPVYLQVMRNELYRKIGNNIFSSSPNSFCSLNGCLACDGSNILTYLISPNSIRPMATSQGNHIGYNEVKVSQTGNGSSVYRYYGSNAWDNVINDVCVRFLSTSSCDLSIPSYPDAPLPFEPMRGELKYEGHYNEAGQIVQDDWHYPEFEEDAIETPGYVVKNIAYIVTVNPGFNVGTMDDPTTGASIMSLTPTDNPLAVTTINARWGTQYMLKSYRRVKDKVISTMYNTAEGREISTTKELYYNSLYHHQLTRSVAYSSTEEPLITDIKYAADFRLSACDAISTGIQTWNTASQTNLGDFMTTAATCTTPANYNCRYQAYQIYLYRQSLARKQYIQTRLANFVNPSNNFDNCHITAKNTADADLKPVLELQEQHQNPAIEHSEWRNGKLLSAGFTKYNYVSNPAGKVFPEKMQALDLKIPSTNFTAATVFGSGLTKDTRYSDETEFIFNTGTLAQVTPRNGVVQTYLWDYLHNRPLALITNAKMGEVAFTSFENGNVEGNWTISDNSRNTTNKISGLQSFDLAAGKTISTTTSGGKQYTVSYWSTSGPATVNANGSNVAASNTGLSRNGWTYYEHMLPNTTTSVLVTGTGTSIDELRLYPVDAEMETFCYAPIIGIVSSCNKANRMTYYEYDALGRLTIVKDQDGNIVKTVKYNYKQ